MNPNPQDMSEDTTTVDPPAVDPNTEPNPDPPAKIDNTDPYGRNAPPAIIGEDLSLAADFADKLEGEEWDAYRATLSKFNGKPLTEVLKSYGEAQKLIGKRQEGMVKLPGEGATEEDLAAFRKALGVPETPDDYKLEIPQGLPEGVELDDAALAPLKAEAHKLGVTPEQLQGLLNFQLAKEAQDWAELKQQQEQFTKEAEESLKKEWGQGYEKKLALVERVKLTGGGLPEGHWGNNDPHIQRLLANIGSKISEGQLGGHAEAVSALSPAMQARDIVMNEANPYHKAYHDSNHPDHESARAQFLRLTKQAAAEQKA